MGVLRRASLVVVLIGAFLVVANVGWHGLVHHEPTICFRVTFDSLPEETTYALYAGPGDTSPEYYTGANPPAICNQSGAAEDLYPAGQPTGNHG